jgi:hypothetical protein
MTACKLIKAATELLPDMIVVDISIPVLNGLHAAERIWICAMRADSESLSRFFVEAGRKVAAET